MVEETIVDKAGFALGMGLEAAGAVKTAIDSAVTAMTEALKKKPARRSVEKAINKKAVTEKAVKKVSAKKAAKKLIVRSASNKKAATNSAAKEAPAGKTSIKKSATKKAANESARSPQTKLVASNKQRTP